MVNEEKLRSLGDPSGHQDANYWDEWVSIVCGEEHQSFEWYCGVQEVVKMLHYHLGCDSQAQQGKTSVTPRMVHPGSGNSLVPVELRDTFNFPHQHVVVDVSNVALEEMQKVHDRNAKSQGQQGRPHIEYIIGNVLQPPLPLDANSFDLWLDKGLLDALFKDAESTSSKQCEMLFDEAYRLLRRDNGMLLIVTLAEGHSLKLILDNWMRAPHRWRPSFHVWELEPASGEMRPFGFVLYKNDTEPADVGQWSQCSMIWHTMQGESITMPIETQDEEHVFQAVETRVREARQQLKTRKSPAMSSVRLVRATLEVKPNDADVKLQTLGQQICEAKWNSIPVDSLSKSRKLPVQWQPSRGADSQESLYGTIVPIGYGISKLVLQCIVNSEDLDDVVEAIEGWGTDEEGEGPIQSVDVDWDNTIPVGDSTCFVQFDGNKP